MIPTKELLQLAEGGCVKQSLWFPNCVMQGT